MSSESVEMVIRVHACPDISAEDKQALRRLYVKFNPAQPKRQITRLQNCIRYMLKNGLQ